MGGQSVNILSCDIFTSYADKVDISMNTDDKFKRSNRDSQETIVIASTSPAMLALSTFKHFGRAIEIALERAEQYKRLVIVYGRFCSVLDMNNNLAMIV